MGNNIVWHANDVSFHDRCKLLKQTGMVVWFTGLSGSGKSTIAVAVEKELNRMGKAVYLLDGDNIRTGINSDLGFSDEDRNENIRRIGEIAALFKDAGIITLVSFISPFAHMRNFARKRVGDEYFLEIYIKASLEACRKRDPKGLYQKEINHFTGISSLYEEPKCPELVLDTENCSLEECTGAVIDEILQRQVQLGGN